jgi:rod shape-determining protein MreD
MKYLRLLAPALAILGATLVCALPWGSAGDFKMVPPLLPYAVIHLAVERRGRLVPDWLVFLAGFATDVAGQGPLGFWALIYLSGYTMVRSATAARQAGALEAIAFFALTIVCLGLMQWSVASIYYLRAADHVPLAVACVAALAVYVLLRSFVPAGPVEHARANDRLERGL